MLKAIGGIIVFILTFIVGIIYTIFKHILRLDYSISRQFTPMVKSIVLSLDGLANAGAGELMNDVLKIKGGIRYGNWHQTISAVTGLIFIHEKDTKLREILDKVLGANHCTDAITEQDKFYYENINKTT